MPRTTKRTSSRSRLARSALAVPLAAALSLGLAGPARAIWVQSDATVAIGNPDLRVDAGGLLQPCVVEAGINASSLLGVVALRGFMIPCIAEDGGITPCIAGVSLAVGRVGMEPCVVPGPGRS